MSRNPIRPHWISNTPFTPVARVVGKRTRPLDWSMPHQGKQEMARRRARNVEAAI